MKDWEQGNQVRDCQGCVMQAKVLSMEMGVNAKFRLYLEDLICKSFDRYDVYLGT